MKPYYAGDGITIYHGDCREILPQLPKVDLVLTDPPYGVGFKYASHVDDEATYWAWMLPTFERIRAMASVVLITTGMRHLWKYPPPQWSLCWAKPGSTRQSDLGGFNEWEPVLVYGKHRIYNDFKLLPDCANHSNDTSGHPCPKPMALYLWLMEQGSGPGNLILDPFMGSGTTLVAAHRLGRRAIGIEIEEKYCEIAVKRIENDMPLFALLDVCEQAELFAA